MSYPYFQTKKDTWGRAILSVSVNLASHLPVKDIGLQDIGGASQQFGLELGRVCFSGASTEFSFAAAS